MTSENNSTNDPANSDARDELLGTLINDFFDRRERGEKLTKEKFLAEHPELADELRDQLSGLDMVDKAGSSVNSAKLPGDETLDAKGSSAEIRESELPHIPRISGYEIHRMIGRGGMGVVYKATQISTKRQVALKVLLEGPLASEQARKRFEREIEVAAQLRHGNIIPIYDSGKSDGRLYYAMAYVRGSSLSDYLSAKRPSIDDRLRIFSKICQAVRHAHQRGVMHRDLKPTNVLVDGDDEPHILDFGLAKASSLVDVNTSVSAQIVGTPAYMSPEQASGDPHGIDTRTDIYSLGVVLYELLIGKMPYDTSVSMGKVLEHIAHTEPTPPHIVDKKISAELSAIVMKALEKSKDRRYQSLDAFYGDIENYLIGAPISVRPATSMYILRKTIWRHRVFAMYAAAVIVIAAGVTYFIQKSTQNLKKTIQDQIATKEQIEQERAQLEQDKLAVEKERDLYAKERDKSKQDLERAYAAVNTLDPRLAEALKAVVSGVSNPYKLPELIAQGAAQGLSTKDEKPQSKLDVISADEPLNFNFEVPAMSSKPPEEKPDYLAMVGNTLAKGLPNIFDVPATQPADAPTSQPATSQPTSQPLSSRTIQADAGCKDRLTKL